jgi:hypothetical protein
MTLSAVGHAAKSIALVIVLLGLADFFLGIAGFGLIALATVLYSAAIRSTRIAWPPPVPIK